MKILKSGIRDVIASEDVTVIEPVMFSDKGLKHLVGKHFDGPH
ncbi:MULTISPECIES: hypothetical protein [unclassified Cedecea]